MKTQRLLKYSFLVLFVSFQHMVMAQSSNASVDIDLSKAKELFVENDFKSALRHIQLAKLTNNSSAEDLAILEIKCLYGLKEFDACKDLIKYSLSSINLSIKSLNVISQIELKIKENIKQKRIQVAKLKMEEKVKSEPSGWSSFLNSAKSSIKSIISN